METKVMTTLAMAAILLGIATGVQVSDRRASDEPEFNLGFKALADLIPDVVGRPVEIEHPVDNGDSEQQTTAGLMVWRKADNWTAFTDGTTTWINGPVGVQSRPSDLLPTRQSSKSHAVAAMTSRGWTRRARLPALSSPPLEESG